MQENYEKVLEIIEAIKVDYEKIQRTGNRQAAKRIRKNLVSIAKLGKEFRKQLLVVMKTKKEKN